MISPNQSKLEYFNSFGLIFDDVFYIRIKNDLSLINLNHLKKIGFHKGRNYKINIIGLLTSSFLIYLIFFFWEYKAIYKYLLYVGVLSSMYVAIISKKFEYKIVIVTRDYQPIKIKVHTDFKNDAKEIVKMTNKKINKRNIHLEAS